MESADLKRGLQNEEDVHGADREATGRTSASRLIEATVSSADRTFDLEKFLEDVSVCDALLEWLGPDTLSSMKGKREVLQKLGEAIARIDEVISRQVNEILHHRRFQQLEASWRGLQYLTHFSSRFGEEKPMVKVKVLNASWKELARDADRVEPDQRELFRKVYTQEYDMPGGEPYGVLIGDYEIHPKPSAEHPVRDLDVLTSISQVAAAAFAPFVAAAHPTFFGVDRFWQLERLRKQELARVFQHQDYVKWARFREREESRFVGLTMPRVLMRLPYEYDIERQDGFSFREDVSGPDASRYLWGNAAYAFAAVLIRTFAKYHWLAEIRGAKPGQEQGGVTTGLPVHSFSTDTIGVAPKSSTDFIISESLDHELGELGFIPLCHCKNTERSAFYSNQSAQKPKVYDSPSATTNADISAMLQYMLCVARFAQTLKVAARDKIGTYASGRELQSDLHKWLMQYKCPDANAPPWVKAKYPLRDATVQVTESGGSPGYYNCIMHLSPQYQLDAVSATVVLRTELRRSDRSTDS